MKCKRILQQLGATDLPRTCPVHGIEPCPMQTNVGNFVRCARCGKRVSTFFKAYGEFVLRAFVECPECLKEGSN